MTLIHKSERDDFADTVTKLGYALTDFEIAEAPDNPDRVDIYAVTGSICIERVSNSVARTYKAGHGSAWLQQFGSDLRQGIFGAT